MTVDQITILVASKDNLRRWGKGKHGLTKLTPDEARKKGLLEPGGESLVQKIRREGAEKRRKAILDRKRRERRKRQREAYRAAGIDPDSRNSS